MIGSHKIKSRFDNKEFIELVRCFSPERVICTEHTFFRLSEKQRKHFNCDEIRKYLYEKSALLVGVQFNGCYAAFYKYPNQRFIRIIMDIRNDKIYVVTFYIIQKNQLPVIK